MAKGSGTTRASSSGSTRGLVGGHYETFIDEDTGESTRVYIRAESPERKKLTADFEKYEASTERKIRKIEAQRDKTASRILELRDQVRALDAQRKEFRSDMEDELARNENAKRRDWYGTRLNRLDDAIDRKRTQFSTANVWYNTYSDRISRLETELENRRKDYREQLKKLR